MWSSIAMCGERHFCLGFYCSQSIIELIINLQGIIIHIMWDIFTRQCN